MIFTTENIEDVRRYYKNTYVKFPDIGETICYIKEISVIDHEGERVWAVQGTTSGGDLFTIPIWGDQPYEVSYVLPRKGFFFYNKQLHQLRRIPARQFSRGITQDNTEIVRFNKSGDFGRADLSAELLQAYVDKPKISIPSVKDLADNAPLLLSRRFALLPFAKAVLLDTLGVGKIEDNKIKMHPLFYPEVETLLQTSDIVVEERV